MIRTGQAYLRRATMAMWGAVLLAAGPALAQPDFGPEQIIQAGGAECPATPFRRSPIGTATG